MVTGNQQQQQARLRGRCVLCQKQGPDNEILSEQLKEIRLATSNADLERLINRFRRLRPAERRPTKPHSDDCNLGRLSNIRSSPFLRPEGEDQFDSLPITTGYESDAQLLGVIQSQLQPDHGDGEVQRSGGGGKWWPNGMSCDEFRDFRRLLFSCRGRRVTPLGVASKFVSKSCCHRPGLSSVGKNQQENKHHYARRQVRSGGSNLNNNHNTGDGASDNNLPDAQHLNKGFHWRVQFLLKRCTGPQSYPKATSSVDSQQTEEQQHPVELRRRTDEAKTHLGVGIVQQARGNNSNCDINWTLRSDKMCGPEQAGLCTVASNIVSQFYKLQVTSG